MKRGSITAILLSLMLLCTACASGKKASGRSESAAASTQNTNVMADYGMMMEEAVAYDSAAETPMEAPAPLPDSQARQPKDGDVRKIIYNADLSITADDPAAVLDALTAKAVALGGYLSDSRVENGDDGATGASATLKVPANQLSALAEAAKAMGKVTSYELYSDDISQSYYDIQARLSSAKAEETQLLELLKKCESVEDVLAVRESLSSVRSDIESYQGQINLWDNQVAYATLRVSIRRTPKAPVEGENELLTLWKASDVWNRMSRGFVNSARFMVNAVGAIGIFLAIAVIPAGILFLCIGLPILLHRKKKKKRLLEAKQAAATPAPVEEAGESDAAKEAPKQE